MNRRELCAAFVSSTGLFSAGCLELLEDEPPDPDVVTESFFDALNGGELDTAKELLHPESPVAFDTIDLSVYEEHNVRTMTSTWVEPDGTPRADLKEDAIPNAVFEDEDRTWVSVNFGIYERDYYVVGVFDLRRPAEEWMFYKEVDEHATALTSQPFSDLYGSER